MLEEHIYITYASSTTFKGELFNDLVVMEARMFKFIVSFAAENMGKKGVNRCGQVKNYYTAWRGVLRKANLWQTEVQQDCK